MSFTFTPKTEDEVSNLLKDGIYKFVVTRAENQTSKKGNPMMKLWLSIWDDKGVEHVVTDFLVEAMLWKVLHYCETVGLESKYQEGKFDAPDCLNTTGLCKIVIERSDDYPAKNVVKDYIKSKHPIAAPTPVESDFIDDDLPF